MGEIESKGKSRTNRIIKQLPVLNYLIMHATKQLMLIITISTLLLLLLLLILIMQIAQTIMIMIIIS